MAAQLGRNYLLKYNTVSTTFVTLGGVQEPSVTVNNDPVDITSADDAGIRNLLQGAGVTSVSIKCSGIYVNDTAADAVRAAALGNFHKQFQLIVPGTTPKTIAGTFMIANFEDSASFKESGKFSFTLESAGPVTIT